MQCCCGVRTASILIFLLYLIFHALFLVINLLILSSPEEHVDRAITFIDTNDNKLHDSVFYHTARELIIQNSGEYFALPITINLVLMVSNLLAAWGGLFFHPLLLLPWLALYAAYILFATSLLIYMIVILQNVWFKVLLFLVVAPIIVVAFAFWLIVYKFYNELKKSLKPGYQFPLHSPMLTMYTPEPHTWDQPLPIWAIAPPQTAWDPVYLQQMDPRYVHGPRRSPWEGRSSRSRISEEGRSRGGFSPREYLYSRSESVSLSDKYNPDKHQSESASLSERYGPKQQLSFAKGSKSSPEAKQRPRNGPNHHTSNLEIEIFDNSAAQGEQEHYSDDDNNYIQTVSHEALVSFEDDEHYKTPRTSRSRSGASTSLAEKYSLNHSIDNLGEQEELTVDFSKYSE